ncbi:pyrroline-5-carboxylate reductase [Desulfurococcus amylolyticus 1221n]|uniref:Pyrroline-5-carboxylate reductase n=1 Tax=Desulfurococcus amylolyticus (strain DSM 18924 / JCM 16383 / VKM B-2413 / 1221n) TaxID=490899 RepID=B8D601_DESA1|nr:pyrroline-5-carboxylate reductase [Desulfurococcus amylolyticus 1221n]
MTSVSGGSIACTEALAVCSQTPCLEGSSASADAPAVYYNIDRIRSWVRKHALNNLAFIFKQCLEIDKSYNYVRWPRDLAYSAALDVLEGTSRLLRESGTHPFKLRDDVTTPAGTTIRGLIAMESEGVKAALMKAVESAYRRSLEIGAEIDARVKRELGIGD